MRSSPPPMVHRDHKTTLPELEQKEIRGVTYRLAWYILFSTAILVSTVLGTYYGLKSDIKDTASKNTLQDVQIQQLQLRMDKLELDMRDYMKQSFTYLPKQPTNGHQ